MVKKNKVADLNKKLEDKLFNAHMDTMYALVDELIEIDPEDLTEAENNFLDALMEWHRYLDSQEKEK
jgi:hypothetical protein